MPTSRYSLATYEGNLEKVRAALMRFSIITVENCEDENLTVKLSTAEKFEETAWVNLLSDLRGVESCEPVEEASEPESVLT